MTRIILVRHGESLWNAEHRYQGQHDSGLTDLGRAQAARVGQHLASTVGVPTAIWSSDLPRARDTSTPYAELVGVPVVEDPRLREIDVGDWSGHRVRDIARTHAETVQAFAGGQDVRRGGGETFGELRSRVAACLDDIVTTHGVDPEVTVVVFSHGGAIQVAAAHASAAPSPGRTRFVGPTNCSVTELRMKPTGDQVVTYNLPLSE